MNIDDLYLPKCVTSKDIRNAKEEVLTMYDEKFNIKNMNDRHLLFEVLDYLLGQFPHEDYSQLKCKVIAELSIKQ